MTYVAYPSYVLSMGTGYPLGESKRVVTYFG
jgi:hypothetical protein